MAQLIIALKVLSKFQAPSFILGPVVAATTTRAHTCTSFIIQMSDVCTFCFPLWQLYLSRFVTSTVNVPLYMNSKTVQRCTSVTPKSYLVCSESRSQECGRQLSLVDVTIMYPKLTGLVPVAARSKAAARLLGLWVRIPPGAWMFVCCECCVLSSRGLCDDLITSPEESYRVWCVVAWEI